MYRDAPAWLLFLMFTLYLALVGCTVYGIFSVTYFIIKFW